MKKNIIGSNIRRYRNELSVTLEELAGEVNLTKSTLSRYEHGLIEPSFETVKDIAFALDVKPALIYGFVDQPVSEDLGLDSASGIERIADALSLLAYGDPPAYHVSGGYTSYGITESLRFIVDELKEIKHELYRISNEKEG